MEHMLECWVGLDMMDQISIKQQQLRWLKVQVQVLMTNLVICFSKLIQVLIKHMKDFASHQMVNYYTQQINHLHTLQDLFKHIHPILLG